jgi:hypothetical protein
VLKILQPNSRLETVNYVKVESISTGSTDFTGTTQFTHGYLNKGQPSTTATNRLTAMK